MVQEKIKNKENYIKKLKSLFMAVDVNGTGRLGLDEFVAVLTNPRVKTWMQILELDVHDAQALFSLIDDGDGEVTFDEFITGLMRLKGNASTMDTVTIMRSTDMALKELDN